MFLLSKPCTNNTLIFLFEVSPFLVLQSQLQPKNIKCESPETKKTISFNLFLFFQDKVLLYFSQAGLKLLGSHSPLVSAQ
jgi:hypothetical protein